MILINCTEVLKIIIAFVSATFFVLYNTIIFTRLMPRPRKLKDLSYSAVVLNPWSVDHQLSTAICPVVREQRLFFYIFKDINVRAVQF